MTEKEFMLFAADVLDRAAAGIRGDLGQEPDDAPIETETGNDVSAITDENQTELVEKAAESVVTEIKDVKADYDERMRLAMQILKGEKQKNAHK